MSYTYTSVQFTSASQINLEHLEGLVRTAFPGKYSYADYGAFPDNTFEVTFVFSSALTSPEATTLDSIIADYEYPGQFGNTVTFSDNKPAGTNGGTFTAGSWVTRDLNTTTGLVNFATLSSNQITLLPGAYTITASAPACNVANNQARLYNVTDSSAILGTNSFTTGGNVTTSNIFCTLKLDAESVFEVQHRCNKTWEGYGLGRATGFDADDEVYTVVNIAVNANS